MRVRKLIATIGVLLFGLSVPALAGAVTLPKVPKGQGSTARYLRVRPAVIVYTGDGSGAVGGTHRLPHCGPLERVCGGLAGRRPTQRPRAITGFMRAASLNCQEGPRSVRAATIRLSAPRVVGGHLIFTRFVVTARGERRLELPITYSNGYYQY